MRLKTKLITLICVLFISVGFYYIFVEDIFINYNEQTIAIIESNNVFNNIKNYLFESDNVYVSKGSISTWMFTDANYMDFYCTFVFKYDSPQVKKCWANGSLDISYQSKLQGTVEWIVNNKYVFEIFYYDKDTSDKIYIYNRKLTGLDIVVSDKVSIPQELHGYDIYFKYSSSLGKFLGFKNGNDIRFQDNYLAIE